MSWLKLSKKLLSLFRLDNLLFWPVLLSSNSFKTMCIAVVLHFAPSESTTLYCVHVVMCSFFVSLLSWSFWTIYLITFHLCFSVELKSSWLRLYMYQVNKKPFVAKQITWNIHMTLFRSWKYSMYSIRYSVVVFFF